jgi:release factor glutamine methyltransferase
MTLNDAIKALKDVGVESAEHDARLLFAHFGNFLPHELVLKTATISDELIEKPLSERINRRPLQYIIGEVGFYREVYEVSEACLIPRSDTEILVETAIRILPINAKFADLCTGSGCIAVSTLAERPDTTAVALEKFPTTLALAEKNAKKNGVDARFCGILDDVLTVPEKITEHGPFDAILSNPPYIPTKDIEALSPEVHAEPLAALDGGEDGLLFYRAILKNYAPLLKKDGFFLFEIGFDQADALTALGKEHCFTHIRVLRDFGGNDRVVYISNIPFQERSSSF